MPEDSTSPAPTILYTEGRKLLDEGKTAEAIQALERAVALLPGNAGWLAGLGAAYVKADRLEDASAAFEKAAVLRPEECRFSLLCASVLLRLGRNFEARANFEAVVAKNPSLVGAWAGLGRAAMALDDAAAAKAAYQQVVAAEPLNAAAHEGLARIAETSGDNEAALHHRATVATLRPDHVPSQLSYAKLLISAAKFSEAAKSCRKVLEIQPAHPSARAISEEMEAWAKDGKPATGEASVRYYDSIYSGVNIYSRDGTELDHSQHFSLICEYLRRVKASSVLDIGCGPGQFAQYLRSQMAIPYVGLDFSRVAIERACKREIANARFIASDITRDPFPVIEPGTAIVCTEVLEHVSNDLDIVACFPEGHPCCCSVPSFHTFSHLRHFQGSAGVKARYGRFFADLEIVDIPLGTGNNRLFLFCGRRNSIMQNS